MEEASIVYDIKGYTYIYNGKTCDEGFIVHPIYPGSLFWNGHDVEQEEDSMGEPIILKQIFKNRPTHKLDKEIKELQDKIQDLKKEINKKKQELSSIEEEIQRIKDTSPEDLLLKKIGSIKNADKLVKALNKEIFMYGLTSDNTPFSKNYGVIGVDLFNGKLLYLCQKTAYSDEYVNQDLSKATFATLEEAEKKCIEECNKQYTEKPKYYSKCIEVDKLFDKYYTRRTSFWERHLLKIRDEELREMRIEIQRNESRIKDSKKNIEKLEKVIKEMES